MTLGAASNFPVTVSFRPAFASFFPGNRMARPFLYLGLNSTRRRL
jgi:hypothetical protein